MVVKARAAWFARWMARAKELTELTQAEMDFKANMAHHVSKILQPKRLLLWREILEDLGYPDLGVIDELAEGMKLAGEVPPCGI